MSFEYTSRYNQLLLKPGLVLAGGALAVGSLAACGNAEASRPAANTTTTVATGTQQRYEGAAGVSTDDVITFDGSTYMVSCSAGIENEKTAAVGDKFITLAGKDKATEFHGFTSTNFQPIPLPVFGEALALWNDLKSADQIKPSEQYRFPEVCEYTQPDGGTSEQ